VDRFPLQTAARYDYRSEFGTGPSDHHGCDIFGPRGTTIVAVERGTVVRDDDPKGGRVVYLYAGRREGDPQERVYYYAHLDSCDEQIPTRQQPHVIRLVEPGDRLGTLGTTGNAAGTSPHLHFQMRVAGELVDPYPYLREVDPQAHGRPPGASTSRRNEPGMRVSTGSAVALLLVLGIAWWAFGGGRRHG
jgi:murein DD-endopeptidase MepM/ murein hydrolase activator NlpD